MKQNKLYILLLAICALLLPIGGTLHDLRLLAQTPHGTASEEVPRGVVDGINATFTLNFQPAPFSSIHVFRNGLRMHRANPPSVPNGDYQLGGTNHTQIIFEPACTPSCIPRPGDTLLADYTY